MILAVALLTILVAAVLYGALKLDTYWNWLDAQEAEAQDFDLWELNQ